MKKQLWILGLTLISVVTACAQPNDRREAPTGKNAAPLSLTEDVRGIRNLLDGETHTCNARDGFNGCPLERLKARARKPSSGANGQRVLILDNFTIPPSVFGRYADRVFKFYWVADERTGELRSWEPEADVPALLTQSLALIDPRRTVRELEPVGMDLNRLHFKIKIRNAPKTMAIDHVTPIFNWLAEWNPAAEFILAEFPVPSEEVLCSLDEAEGRKTFALFYGNAARALAKIVRENSIDFVNLSYTPTEESLAAHYRRLCRKSFGEIPERDREMLQMARTRLLTEMQAANDGLLVVQAAPNNQDRVLERNDPGAPFMCHDLPQSLVVGFFAKKDAYVPRDGVFTRWSWMHPAQRNVADCVDAFVNGGMTEATDPSAQEPTEHDEYSLYQNYHGVFLHPEPLMATSWATPMALSMAMEWKRTSRASTPTALKAIASGKMWDPLQNKSFTRSF